MKTIFKVKNVTLALITIMGLGACKKSPNENPVNPIPVNNITITQLKALSTQEKVQVADGTRITGTVISDVANKNIDSKTVVLQEATGKPGIIVNFDAAQSFALGDELEVDISKQSLQQVNGEITLDKIPASNAKKTGKTNTISPRKTTVAEILKNSKEWNGTLIAIEATQMTGGDGKYKGSLVIKEKSGTINTDIKAGASFENTDYPQLLSQITGLVRINNTTISLNIRNSSDAASGIIRTIVEDDFTNTKLAYDIPLHARIPVDVDDFLNKTKKYTYAGIATTDLKLQGLRTININLAFSKFTGLEGELLNDKHNVKIVYPFTADKDINTVRVRLDLTIDDGFDLGRFDFKDVGVLHNIAVRIPNSKAELKATLLASGQSEDGASANADYFWDLLSGVTTPDWFRITVTGDHLPLRVTNPDKDRTDYVVIDPKPFVVEKITYGFDK